MGKQSPHLDQSIKANQDQSVSSLLGSGSVYGGLGMQSINEGNLAQNEAQQHYQNIASGSPTAIATAMAPAAQQIAKAGAGAKQNIMQNAPAGGEKNLALEQVSAEQGAKIGEVATNAYEGAFPALGQIGAQRESAGINLSGMGISATEGAGSLSGNMQSQNLELQKMQIEQQAQSLAMFATLASDVAMGAAGMPPVLGGGNGGGVGTNVGGGSNAPGFGWGIGTV